MDLDEIESELALAEGDSGPLIARMRGGAPLSETERQIAAKILEASAAGKSWRPRKRPAKPEWRKRCEAMRYRYYMEYLIRDLELPKKVAHEQTAAEAGLSQRQLYRLLRRSVT